MNRAVQAALAGTNSAAYAVADGYTLDLVAAVANHPAASAGLAAEGVSAVYKRNLARTAVLLARPRKT